MTDWRKIERELHHLFSELVVVEHIADESSHEYRQTTVPHNFIESGRDGGDQYFDVILRRDSEDEPIDTLRIDLTLLAKRLANL